MKSLKNVESAEIIGIMLGDGCLYHNKKYNIYQTTVSGHSIDDQSYLLDFVSPLFTKIFGIHMGIRLHRSQKELQIINQRNILARDLESLGFKIGNKKNNNIGIPKWVKENKKFSEACLRGIVDTDGSLVPKTPKHPMPSIWIKSVIPQLREDIMYCFRKLEFNPSKWTRRRVPQCCLGKSHEVMRYYNEIGFNNPKHLNRFYKLCRSRSLVVKDADSNKS